uniref:DUF4168 domain-containing protein n=1 Tax=Panagrellus redivivus TaxID=6233 RepID=A0A7E4VTY5_PANRE
MVKFYVSLSSIYCFISILFVLLPAFYAKPMWSSYISPSQNARRLSPAFAHALFPAAWAAKYGMVPIIQKDLLTDLKRLSQKALEYRRKWQRKHPESQESKSSPVIVNLDKPKQDGPTKEAYELAKLQLRDCVYIRTGCADPQRIDNARAYLDSVQTFIPSSHVLSPYPQRRLRK